MNRSSLILFLLMLNLGSMLHAQNWTFTQKLGSSDQAPGDNLGISVAVSDSFLIAGAWWADLVVDPIGFLPSAGAAYIYKMNSNGTWYEIQKLISPTPEALGYFGFYVEIDGDFALVGAFNEDHSGVFNAGKVYSYHRDIDDQWVLHDTLKADDSSNNDNFGINLGMTDGYAFIGAPNHDYDEQGNNFLDEAGAGYLFKQMPNNQWTKVRKLVAFDRAEGDELGKNVDIDQRGLVFGAATKDFSPAPLEAGVAYGVYFDDPVSGLNFENVTSADLKRFQASDQDSYENFGWDVAISGHWAVVGKSSESNQPGGVGGSNTGAAYFFYWENGQWVQKQKVYASDFSAGAHFGRSIAIDGPICVIGAGTESEDEYGNNYVSGAGAAYIFELQPNQQWAEVLKIAGSQRAIGDLFGEDAIDLNGTNIAVGAWLADTIGGTEILDGGAVYTFKRDAPLISVRELSKIDGVSLLNNPSNGLLQLQNNGGEAYPASVSIFSVEGKLLSHNQIFFDRTWQTDLSQAPAGIYFVQIRREGYLPQSWKWVKQ